MIIGTFNVGDGADDYPYKGTVSFIGFSGMVWFQAAPTKGARGPDFAVWTGHFAHSATEIGAAWVKTSKAGKPYLSVKLDGPMLVQPINCALTKQQDGSYALVWSRKDAKADEQPAAEEAAA
jgi:uncharacterized protein (DUF736 family)